VTSRAAKFAAVFAGLLAAHNIADYWVQHGGDACDKQKPGRVGQLACARHVTTYTITTGLTVTALDVALNLDLSGRGIAAGQLVSAVTHYVVDRGAPLRCIAAHTGSIDFIERVTVVRKSGQEAADVGPGTGAYSLDQSWHIGWLAVAALVTAVI
jgi:hypothetical protein